MLRRRRPLARAAVVGGAAYYAGKKVQQGKERDADQDAAIEDLQDEQDVAAAPEAAESADDKYAQLTKLKELLDQGILTQAEFDLQKTKILQTM